MKVSARLTDWEEMAVRKPRPSAGMTVDWQMKPLTELTNWAASSPCSSLLDTSVTLSMHTAAGSPCRREEEGGSSVRSRLKTTTTTTTTTTHLMAAQLEVEQVQVLRPFGGETGSDGQRGHVAHEPEVKGQRAVVLRVAEEAVAVTARVFLPEKDDQVQE